MKELKHCPFCGGEAIIQGVQPLKLHGPGMGTRYYATCPKCEVCGPVFRLYEDAAKAWNRRAEGKED